MNNIRFFKPIVFIFECIKLMIIAIIFIIHGDVHELFSKILFAASGALFPLMALFIWLDTGRYKEYLPLFMAGKCIGIFLLLGWFIIFRQATMIGSIFGSAIYAEALLLCGDFVSLGAVFLINKDIKNSDMEEK